MSAWKRAVSAGMLVSVMTGVSVTTAQDAAPADPPPGCNVVAEGLTAPRDLAVGADGTVFVVVDGDAGAAVARIAPDGAVTTLGQGLPVAPPDTAPSGLATAPGGDVWLLQPNGVVARLLEDGAPEAFGPVSGATGLGFDADGQLLVSVGEAGQVWRCDPAGVATTAATEVTLSMRDVFFEPNDVTIPANTDVTLHVVNDGFAFHNLAIPAAGVATPQLGAGGTHDLVVNLPPGDYEIICEVRGHRTAGMVGVLHVAG